MALPEWLRGFLGLTPLEEREEQRAITFQDVWGTGADVSTTSTVSMDKALTLSSVYSATSLIADLVSSFPTHGYRKQGEQRISLDPQPSLCSSPTVFGTSVDWTHRCVISLAMRGNAYGLITDVDDRQYPRKIEWLHPDDVTIMDNRAEGRPDWRYLGKPLDASRLLHIPYYSVPGYVLGLSPIKAYALAVDVGLFSQAFGRDYFRGGSIPAGILKTDQRIDDPEKADVIKARFKRDAARREPVVLGSGLDYQTISVAPDESQFLHTIRATATQIAAIYHLDPTLIGGEVAGGSLTYANVEQRSLDLVKLALVPYVRRIEEALRPHLPGQQFIKFNMDAFIRPDTLNRFSAYKMALDAGWMSRDEIRALEDLPPMPHGLGKFIDPIQQAQKLAAVTGKVTGPTGDGQPANGSSGAANGRPSATNGSSSGSSSGSGGASNGRTPAANGARAAGVDELISIYGRRSDPWV
jgi:HK97 family phage portal protein